MSKLYVTKNNRRYERKRDKITISLTHAPSTVFSTTQLVLEFHIGGTGVSLMWYWRRTCMNCASKARKGFFSLPAAT